MMGRRVVFLDDENGPLAVRAAAFGFWRSIEVALAPVFRVCHVPAPHARTRRQSARSISAGPAVRVQTRDDCQPLGAEDGHPAACEVKKPETAKGRQGATDMHGRQANGVTEITLADRQGAASPIDVPTRRLAPPQIEQAGRQALGSPPMTENRHSVHHASLLLGQYWSCAGVAIVGERAEPGEFNCRTFQNMRFGECDDRVEGPTVRVPTDADSILFHQYVQKLAPAIAQQLVRGDPTLLHDNAFRAPRSFADKVATGADPAGRTAQGNGWEG